MGQQVVSPKSQWVQEPHDDPLLIRVRQERVERLIDRLESAKPGDSSLRFAAESLGKEVSRYQATESDLVWPIVEEKLPNQGVDALAQTARDRGEEIVELTSEALAAFNAARRLPNGYREQIAELFEQERSDLYGHIGPSLDEDIVGKVRRSIMPFYPEELGYSQSNVPQED